MGAYYCRIERRGEGRGIVAVVVVVGAVGVTAPGEGGRVLH